MTTSKEAAEALRVLADGLDEFENLPLQEAPVVGLSVSSVTAFNELAGEGSPLQLEAADNPHEYWADNKDADAGVHVVLRGPTNYTLPLQHARENVAELEALIEETR
mgnify:FL=1